jgi:hypothetical protein
MNKLSLDLFYDTFVWFFIFQEVPDSPFLKQINSLNYFLMKQ